MVGTGTGRRSSAAGALAAALALAVTPAAAAGLAPGTLPVTNETGGALACEAALAHWFSVNFGEIAAGATLTLPLLRAPDGTIVLIGPKGDEMAVEALWCGRPGAAYATRAVIELPRRAGEGAWPERIVCRDMGRLACAPETVSSPASPR